MAVANKSTFETRALELVWQTLANLVANLNFAETLVPH